MKPFNYLAIIIMLTSLIACSEKPNQPQTTIVCLTSSDTTGLLMKEDEFWEIIDKSIAVSHGDYQNQIIALQQILTIYEPTQIEKFANTFTALSVGSYNNALWGAAYVINGGCSDDCFEYFRDYLIAHGKEKFYATLYDPESCVAWMRSESDDNWEGIGYSAPRAYLQITGKEIPSTYLPERELKGPPFEDATVRSQYPKLAKKFD